MKVVLDTNVIVSATISQPSTIPARLLIYWQQRAFTLVVSEPILQEYKKALTYPHIQQRHQKTSAQIETFLKSFQTLAQLVEQTKEVNRVQEDPDDNKFLACAIAGNAEYIVSGDTDLLRVREYRGIHILTPRAFLTLLEQEEQAA